MSPKRTIPVRQRPNRPAAKTSAVSSLPRLSTTVAGLLPEIQRLIDEARHRAVTAANLSMVALYWNLGRIINTELQRAPGRADYGGRLVEALALKLGREYGPGFSVANLWDMKRFHAAFQILQPVARELGILQPAARESARRITPAAERREPPGRLQIDFSKHYHLGWTHYRILLAIADEQQRRFYFERACAERWSKRELQRQLAGALFERVALSRDTLALAKTEKKNRPRETANYREAFKDPYLLDFLGLPAAYSEKDLETAIINNLQEFITELGNDFCFIRRQYSMRIDDDDYFLDLLFYHRRLRCLVAIDLKIGPFATADKAQMDLYLAWLKRHEWRDFENEPVGLILCTSAKRQHVELLLADGPHKVQVAEYLTQLPKKKVFKKRLKMYGRALAQQSMALVAF